MPSVQHSENGYDDINIHRVWKKVYVIFDISSTNLNIFSLLSAQVVYNIHMYFPFILCSADLIMTSSKMPFLLYPKWKT